VRKVSSAGSSFGRRRATGDCQLSNSLPTKHMANVTAETRSALSLSSVLFSLCLRYCMQINVSDQKWEIS